MGICESQSIGESGQKCGLGPAKACSWVEILDVTLDLVLLQKTVALGKQNKLILRQSLISSPSHPTLQGLNQADGVSQGSTGW